MTTTPITAGSISTADVRLETRVLVTFVAVAEHRSFSAAARTLRYTQSAVSQQIANLEATIGHQLIVRPGGPRQISLTDAGERLLGHARAILSRLALAEADMAALSTGERGTLRVGTFQSTAVRVLPEVLRRFRAAWPSVTVDMTEQSGDDGLLTLLENGDLDLTFVMLPVREGPFLWRRLLNGEYVLLTSADSAMATQPTVPTIEEISRLPLIGYRNIRRAHRLEEHLIAMGYQPEIVFRTDENASIQRLAGIGFGAAIVPRLAVDESDPMIAIRHPLAGLQPFVAGVAWHQDRPLSEWAQALIDTAVEVCAAMQDPALAPAPVSSS